MFLHSLVIIILLIFQYLLGLWSNLWIAFPSGEWPTPANDTNPATLPAATVPELWAFGALYGALITHIINGITIWLLLWALLIRGVLAKSQLFIYAPAVSLTFVSGAIVCGPLFVSTQLQDFSYLMAFSFLFALLGQGAVFMYVAFPKEDSSSSGTSGSTGSGRSGTSRSKGLAQSAHSSHSKSSATSRPGASRHSQQASRTSSAASE